MTTGLDITAAGDCIGAGFGSEFEIDVGLFMDCVCVSTGLWLRGEGLDRVRVPIFSDLELSGDGGDCCR
jgi:hypothetical protein